MNVDEAMQKIAADNNLMGVSFNFMILSGGHPHFYSYVHWASGDEDKPGCASGAGDSIVAAVRDAVANSIKIRTVVGIVPESIEVNGEGLSIPA